jgi:hypothetical protein
MSYELTVLIKKCDGMKFDFFGYTYKIENEKLYYKLNTSDTWLPDDLSLWGFESLRALKTKLYALSRGC